MSSWRMSAALSRVLLAVSPAASSSLRVCSRDFSQHGEEFVIGFHVRGASDISGPDMRISRTFRRGPHRPAPWRSRAPRRPAACLG